MSAARQPRRYRVADLDETFIGLRILVAVNGHLGGTVYGGLSDIAERPAGTRVRRGDLAVPLTHDHRELYVRGTRVLLRADSFVLCEPSPPRSRPPPNAPTDPRSPPGARGRWFPDTTPDSTTRRKR